MDFRTLAGRLRAPARVNTITAVFTGLALLGGIAPRHGYAQDAPPDGWSFLGELTSVMSAGNAKALTFGLGSTVERRAGPNLLKLEAGGLRTESTIITRRAIGSAGSYEIQVRENRETTAEAYNAGARLDRTVSERFFVYGGANWMRNTFSGIDSRTVLAVGAGNIWLDNETSRLRTSYAVTYTFQQDVVSNPDVSDRFGGARVGWEYWQRATPTTVFESKLVTDLNLDQTDDVRADLTNSVTVSISDAIALKPSLQLLWRNLPALTEVQLYSPIDESPLGVRVLTPLEKTDMLFRLALVVTL